MGDNINNDLREIGILKGLEGEQLDQWVQAMTEGGAVSKARLSPEGIPVDNREIRSVGKPGKERK